MPDDVVDRRDLLLAPLLAALPMALIGSAQASPLNPAQTMVTLPDQIVWKTRPDWPEHSNAQATLFGDTDKPGIYYALLKWYPGYMSGPPMLPVYCTE